MADQKLEFSKQISAPSDKVWDAISDAAKMPKWFKAVESAKLVGASAVSKGVKRDIVMTLAGKKVHSHQEIVTCDPGKALGWKHVKDLVDGKPFEMFQDIHVEFALKEADGGTKVDVWTTFAAKGFKAKLAMPVAKKSIGDQTKEMLSGLKAFVEK